MNRRKLIITAIILALILAIGGILAYFTDVQTKTNKFKTGSAKITVTEPSWPNGETNTPVDVVPGQTVAKDPIITNIGDGSVFAFVEVNIPKETVLKKGTGETSQLQELFTTSYISTPANPEATPPVAAVYTNGVNPNWVLLKTENKAADSTTTPPTPASVTYVYAYGSKDSSNNITLTELKNTSGQNATPPIFDAVTFIDVVEDHNTAAANSVQGKNYEVKVSGYGIQADGLDTTDAETIFGYAKGN